VQPCRHSDRYQCCPISGAVPPLLSENLSGEGAALTRRAVASARTVAAHASAHLLQAITTLHAAL
jgi:hypothetical protein